MENKTNQRKPSTTENKSKHAKTPPSPSSAKPKFKSTGSAGSSYYEQRSTSYPGRNRKETTDELFARLLQESNKQNERYLQFKLNQYVDHCVGLMFLNSKLEKLLGKEKKTAYDFDLFDDDEDTISEHDDIDDDFDLDFFKRGKGFKTKETKEETTKKKQTHTKQKKSSKGFTLYDQYSDDTSKFKLDEGLFTVQVDVGGSCENEILVDSLENHLTVKSKDTDGRRHIFGIICPTVDDVDKLIIHVPKNGLLTIEGPLNKKRTSDKKKN